MDKNAITLGLQIGRLIAGQREKKKVPVAYLYNGVRLPALPEWDREEYPYAVIAKGFYGYSLYLSKNNPYAYISSSAHASTVIAWNGERIWIECINEYTEWEPETEWYVSEDSNVALDEGSLAWSNCDIEMDGNVWLYASEPIPVYE